MTSSDPALTDSAQVYLLQVFGPVRRLGHGHEAAVGQDGAHDEQTEQRKQVKEKRVTSVIHISIKTQRRNNSEVVI